MVISAVEAHVFTRPWEIHLQAGVWLVFSGTDKELFLWTLCLDDITWMQTYSTLLSDQLQPAICKKQRGRLQKGVIFQHDWFSKHLSDSRENWRDGLGIVPISTIQSRLSSKWFLFVWTTQGIVWWHWLRTMKKMFNNYVSGSFYTVSQKKLGHFYFYCNHGKCWSIFKIFSLLGSEGNSW